LLVDKPPTGPQWVHAKFDGYRVEARIDGDDIRLLTRKAFGWTKRFPTIAGDARQWGESVAVDDDGNIYMEMNGSKGVERYARHIENSRP
jgi:bifunctional non-homologous end joining protein LigD